jgi:hypothetical protein
MAEQATGISTRNPDTWVATFEGSEIVGGHTRQIQVVGITTGKIAGGLSRLSVSTNDSMDVTSVSGSVVVGDNSHLVCYVTHTQNNGACLVTPLLCDNDGVVIGYLPPKISNVKVPVQKSGKYLSICLSWEVMSTGAWKIFPLVSELSDGNSVDVYTYTF